MTKSKVMSAIKSRPVATASLKGSALFPDIRVTMLLYPMGKGSIVEMEALNLPKNDNASGFYGLHIHEGSTCGIGGSGDPYSSAGGHFNPKNLLHPLHAGDLPVLMNSGGYGYMLMYTDRFTPKDVIGKAAVLHGDPDDFRSQPSGNSGVRIACGVITQL